MTVSRRSFLATMSAGGALPVSAGSASPESLEQGFASPPVSARPWTYWFWLNGHMTREGITADLEAMKRVGIHGVIIMSNEGKIAPGPVRFMTVEWRELFRHVVSESKRLGITVDMNNDDGWNSGGPWIEPLHAMQRLVWTETRVNGPQKLGLVLPQPRVNLGFYREIAVLAFPTPDADVPSAAPASGRDANGAPYRQVEFPAPFTARTIVITSQKRAEAPAICELLVSDDGVKFRTVRRFDTGWGTGFAAFAAMTIAIPETTGRFWRMSGADWAGKHATDFHFQLRGGARVGLWEMKAGYTYIREHGGGAHMLLPAEGEPRSLTGSALIRRESVVDLTGRTDSSSRLEWEVPEGDWTIFRVGHTPTGAGNGPATPEGKGLDCDKLSRAAVEKHFSGMLGRLIDDVRPLVGKSFSYIHNDSWECGAQNWTGGFREEFRNRRGYDLLPYLPVMAGGRVVGSYEVSDRFLWDVRRTLSDMMREHYWSAMGELARTHGLRYSIEPAGRQQFLYDPINLLSKGDLPMGEFWVTEERARPDCKLAASAAHLYGRRVVGAEAFTCNGGPGGEWQAHPFWMKAKGDEAFCNGVNHLVFHRYVHQPSLNRRPGMHWGTVGIQAERTQTWWEAGAAWIDYLSRCQFMLQQGSFVGDVCYLTGEGAPNALVRSRNNPPAGAEGTDASINSLLSLARRGGLPLQLPLGYDFDGCNPESVMRMSVRDGRLVLPSGMSYRLLILPVERTMTPALLRKLRNLIADGAVVAGPMPLHSPSLADYEKGDEEVRQIAAQVWGNCDGKNILEHAFGKGKVIWGLPVQRLMAALDLPPDFEYSGGSNSDLDYIHRRDGDIDIYFISNQTDHIEETACTFRVAGKRPELWYPETGHIVKPAAYTQEKGRTTITLQFEPAGSVFVVFRSAPSTDHVVSLSRDGRPIVATGATRLTAAANGGLELITSLPGSYEARTGSGRTFRQRVGKVDAPHHIDGPWQLKFPAGWGAPAQITLPRLVLWNEHPDIGVKHFSGTAAYEVDFELPANWTAPGKVLFLNLGTVREIAEVVLNGKRAGTLWKPPFRLEITGVHKPGLNHLEVKVTNLWPNRLIGDSKLPEDKRFTWTVVNPYKPDSPLLESGLLGPVRIEAAERLLLRD